MKFSSLAKNIALGSVLLAVSNANAYDIIKRTKLIDDRLKTQELLRPFGHDFIIDIGANVTPDTQDLIDEADNIDNLQGGSSINDDLTTADNLLRPYYGKENIIRARVNLGIPIFSFTAYGFKVQPNFRADAGITGVITPNSESVSLTNIIDNLDQIPADIRNGLKSGACASLFTGSPSPAINDGDDILVYAVTNNCITQQQANAIKETYDIDSLPYVSSIATTSQDLPYFDLYAKIDAKVGFTFDYTDNKHWFGTLGVNALARTDIKKRVDATLLIAGGGSLEPQDNLTTNLILDYTLGYKNDNYWVTAGVEELKLFTLSDPTEGTVAYGEDALFRIHGQADYTLSIFKLSPFIGSHARSGYGFGDAYYLGADWGLYVWGDRLGLNFRTMLDKEHVTLGARMKLWLMQLEATYKVAATDKVDGVTIADIISANIRFFF